MWRLSVTEAVTLTIDDQTVTVSAGTTILDAAASIGIDIPTICYHPSLTPPAICRLCTVEVEKQRVLPPACVVPVANEIVVKTNSARVQTVHPETNPRFYRLLDEFDKLTSCPVLVNTSFNVRGEPIVCNVDEAYRCFMRTEMDTLVLENLVLIKNDQPKWQDEKNWREEFELD